MPRNPPAWGGRVGTRGWHCRERPRCRANGAPGPKPAAHESLGSAAGGASDWREQAPGGIVMADPPGKIREALSRFQQVLAHPRRARETPPPLRDVGQTAGCLSRFGLKTAFPLGSSPVCAGNLFRRAGVVPRSLVDGDHRLRRRRAGQNGHLSIALSLRRAASSQDSTRQQKYQDKGEWHC